MNHVRLLLAAGLAVLGLAVAPGMASAAGQPSISLTTPPAGATTTYPAGAVPDASYSCTPASGQTLQSCTATVDAQTVASGDPLPGGVGSNNALTVTATDTDGGTDSVSGTYVIEGPTESITTPAGGNPDYAQGSVPAAAFSCTPDPSSTLSSCTASVDNGPPFADGSQLPDGLGQHSMEVTGLDADGATTSQTVLYSVSGPPTVTFSAPTDGADYASDSVPAADFSCNAAPYTTVSSCTAIADGNAISNGAQLPSAVGSHTVTVTVDDADGQSTTQSATYTVSGAPAVSISQPGGQDYAPSQVPAASFSCTAGANTTVSCAATVDGNAVSDGGQLPSSVGSHTVTATASGGDGQSAVQTVVYTVSGPPTVTFSAPTDGADYASDSVPAADFSCNAAPYTTVSSCTAIADGNAISNGAQLPSAVGSHTVTVTVDDADGQSTTQSATYTVSGAPAVSISQPGGQDYAPSQVPAASFSCTAGANTTVSCAATVDGNAVSDGGQLPSSVGSHTVTATASGGDGQSAVQTVVYTVSGPPTISLSSPVDGEDYYWQSIPASDFSCAAGVDGTLSSCAATVDNAPLASGSALPDAIGSHTVTVTATETDGQSSSQTVSYVSSLTVVPFVSANSPTADARYTLGQVVDASYSCLPARDGPAVRSCVGTVASGRPLDTASLGKHSFQVTATDATGQSSTVAITYTVIPTTNRFTLRHVATNHRGVATVTLDLPGPGKLQVLATARSGRRRVVYGRTRKTARSAGRLTVTVAPSGAGRRLLRARRAAPAVQLAITYTPTGGKPRELRSKQIRIR